MKIKIDELDTDAYQYKYTNFDSDLLEKLQLERIVYDETIETTDSGCHYKLVGHFHTKGDVVCTEEGFQKFFQIMLMAYKAVAQYLIDNPDVCA